MPLPPMHFKYALIFMVVFLAFSLGIDFDHFKSKACVGFAEAKVLGKPYDAVASKQTNCRGIFHTLTFGLIILALVAAWILHIIMDYLIFPA